MRYSGLLAGIVAVVLTAPMIHGQQSSHKPEESHRAESTTMGMDHPMMPTMDSLDRRLDSLVNRMNRAGDGQKLAAMAAVINELVAQRKTMRSHMREMMRGHGSAPSARTPAPARDSAVSDSAHAGHHPPE
jgi:hypothetical protein